VVLLEVPPGKRREAAREVGLGAWRTACMRRHTMSDLRRRFRDKLIDITDVREHPGRFIALGISFMILGVLAIIMPFVAGVAIIIGLGWLLVLAGLVEGVHAVFDQRWGGSIWSFIGGLISVVAGVLLIARPVTGKLYVTLVLAAFLGAEGLVKVVRALSHRGLVVWGWMFLDGILSLLLGALIWLGWPSTAAWALGLLVGIELMFSGVSMLALGLGAGRVSEAARPAG
jgi:uncharacterized membrane protein HdeD (DUF308 family)